MSNAVKHTGIVLKKTPCFEKDCMVELLTPDMGKKKLIAKYALTKSFKFGGLIEPTQVINCDLYQGATFLILKQCQRHGNFPHIRSHFNTISMAIYFISIIRHSTQFDQPVPQLYQLLSQGLSQLNATADLDHLKTQFHIQFLHAEGLLHDTETITDSRFSQLFYEYTRIHLTAPLFLTSTG